MGEDRPFDEDFRFLNFVGVHAEGFCTGHGGLCRFCGRLRIERFPPDNLLCLLGPNGCGCNGSKGNARIPADPVLQSNDRRYADDGKVNFPADDQII